MQASPSTDERTWGMISHVLLFTGVLAPVLLWILILRRSKTEFVVFHATEALNFFITCFLTMALIVLAWPVPVPWWFTLPFVMFAIVMTVLACLAAKRGERYRYPLALRILK